MNLKRAIVITSLALVLINALLLLTRPQPSARDRIAQVNVTGLNENALAPTSGHPIAPPQGVPPASSSQRTQSVAKPTAAPNAPSRLHTGVTQTAAIDPVASPVKTLGPLKRVIPTKNKMREEVTANPHRTPEALLNFSIELGERADKAAETEEKAHSFFPELESCILDPKQKGRHSVQALCLLNAKNLTEKYRSLDSKYARLIDGADPLVVELVEKAIR